LSDAHLRGIARTGGVIGIAYFDVAVCGTEVKDIARAIRYAADTAGVDALAARWPNPSIPLGSAYWLASL